MIKNFNYNRNPTFLFSETLLLPTKTYLEDSRFNVSLEQNNVPVTQSMNDWLISHQRIMSRARGDLFVD